MIQRMKPDVVHTHSSKAGILGRGAAWSARVPAVVHTIHGLPFGPSERPFNNFMYVRAERWAAKRCHAIISVCDAMTEQALAARVGRPEQFTTIYSGMEVDAFLNPARPRDDVRRELGLSAEHIAFGTVARLFERKGHDDVLAVAPSVLAVNPNVRFVFVGDGVLRERLMNDARRLGIAHAIHFTGLVPTTAIPSLLGAMDAVVHPSLREGLARVLPQALLVGIPVISYDIDGAREVVREDTGILLKPRDHAGLASAILRLAGDRKLRRSMGYTGRTRFTEPFRHDRMVREIRSLYTRLLDARPGGEIA
jgi:glycosyltransferase involved in cell wall biosynthesis